jgi:hypothetical protein
MEADLRGSVAQMGPAFMSKGTSDHGKEPVPEELNLDPLLIALLKKIPPSGDWPAAQRVRWFRTFAMNVSQIYDGDGEPVEMKIDVEKWPPVKES